jgi:hypothetical protein
MKIKIIRKLSQFIALFLITGFILKYSLHDNSDIRVVMLVATILFVLVSGYLTLVYSKRIKNLLK